MNSLYSFIVSFSDIQVENSIYKDNTPAGYLFYFTRPGNMKKMYEKIKENSDKKPGKKNYVKTILSISVFELERVVVN